MAMNSQEPYYYCIKFSKSNNPLFIKKNVFRSGSDNYNQNAYSMLSVIKEIHLTHIECIHLYNN
jgi:hypothetical protein